MTVKSAALLDWKKAIKYHCSVVEPYESIYLLWRQTVYILCSVYDCNMLISTIKEELFRFLNSSRMST